jgi:hypothetical protein
MRKTKHQDSIPILNFNYTVPMHGSYTSLVQSTILTNELEVLEIYALKLILINLYTRLFSYLTKSLCKVIFILSCEQTLCKNENVIGKKKSFHEKKIEMEFVLKN